MRSDRDGLAEMGKGKPANLLSLDTALAYISFVGATINRVATLTDRRGVTPEAGSPHWRRLLEVIMKVYSTAEFARKHGVSDSRIRQLIAEDRVFPRQKLGNGRHIMFQNSVIVAPYERTNRKLRGAG